MKKALVATSDTPTAELLSARLEGSYAVQRARESVACQRLLAAHRPELVFLDLELVARAEGEPDLAQALAPFRREPSAWSLVVLCRSDRVRWAVEAVANGADNYLTVPLVEQELDLVLTKLAARKRMYGELQYLRDSFWKREAQELVRTRSPLMREVYAKVESVAPTRATVLLTGETGTGKSLMAKLIHMHSNRAAGPLVAVHCGSIPENLVESELFGHEKGSFTGAERRRLGKFEIADRGTIFLDEIGTMPPPAQVKLLQVLQEGAFSRVGGEATITVDMRVVAASNAELKQRVADGGFRADLYHRFNVFAIELPPLRERREDIPLLALTLLGRLENKYAKGIQEIDQAVIAAFMAYDWPGNIRELENLLERAYILERGGRLGLAGFPPELQGGGGGAPPLDDLISLTLAEARRRAVERLERTYLVELLTVHRGRIDASAAQAGLTGRQLHNLMTKHDLSRQDFR
jgi:DNA-binding NtrC family response regulator